MLQFRTLIRNSYQKVMFGFLNRIATLSRVSMIPPSAVDNRHGIAIVAIVKNESRYIGEWASFHLKAGVRKFYIYDNGSTDNTLDVLSGSLPEDALTIIPWNQTIGDARYKSVIHNQVLAYAHAASNFGGDYRWMAFIDVDEFMVPKKASSLTDVLEKLSAYNNISLPWHMYGTSGHKADPGGSVVENYRFRFGDPITSEKKLRNFKCIIDPCSLTSVRVHSMQSDGQWLTCNDKGQCVDVKQRFDSGFYSSDEIQLNHYYTRSEEEFINKMNKGHIIKSRSTRYVEKLPAILKLIDSDVVEDVCAVEFLDRIGAH